MKPEEFKSIADDILTNLTDQAKVSTLLSKLSDDFAVTVTEAETAKKTAETMTTANESLRQANMSLFLKIGETKKEEPVKPDDSKPSFESLFDKEGNLL